MDLFIFPHPLRSNQRARVRVVGGPSYTTAKVEVDNGGRPQPLTARLEIALDEKGNGSKDWVLPPWEWVNLKCEGCEPVSRPIAHPVSLATTVDIAVRLLVSRIRFICGGAGREHGVRAWQRFKLVVQVAQNGRRIVPPVSSARQQLHLIETILRVPPSVGGDVVECGCFNGGSTTMLSLACSLTHRRLFVCDSFEGLPEPRADEKRAFYGEGETDTWRKGRFASRGGLEGVKRNIAAYGHIEACHFVKGFFSETLGHLPTESIVLVFEDADLVSSVEDCLRHLWPKLQPGSKFYCHEPWSIDVVSLFYDKTWWKREFGLRPPGFFGSGEGTNVAPQMGYAVKLDPAKARPA